MVSVRWSRFTTAYHSLIQSSDIIENLDYTERIWLAVKSSIMVRKRQPRIQLSYSKIIAIPWPVLPLLFGGHAIAGLHSTPNTQRKAITFRQSASCYYPNGDLSLYDIPCSTGEAGPCCPYQWQCERNGLCYLESEALYGRFTCTDQTWSSDSCPQICTHGMIHPLLPWVNTL